MTPTPDKALGAAVLAFLATLAGALLDGSLAWATLPVALGAGIAAGLTVYRIPRTRPRRPLGRRRHRRT